LQVAAAARSAKSWVAEGEKTVTRPGLPAIGTRFEMWYAQAAPFKARMNVLTLTAEGFAEDIRVTSSPGMGLEEKAIECVKAWRWQPGMRDGQPVAVRAKVEVNFRLTDGQR
jgi:TonB-like protein